MNVTRFVSIGLVTALNSGGYQALAQTSPTVRSAPEVPETIQVPVDQQLLFSVTAKGEQIYLCQAIADQPNQFGWILKAPEAELFDQQGRSVGQHYGGPTWELTDGSKIVGQLNTKVDAPQADAIPWLLLQVKSHDGNGMFSPVKWIQRVHTVGGKAPQTGCDLAHQNQEVRIDYAADYYFYGEE